MSDDIRSWLAAQSLARYGDVFEENGIDLRALPLLQDDDLKELGVLLGHRRILQAALAELAPTELASGIKSPMAVPSPPTAQLSEPELEAVTAPSEPQGQRRQVTVLFADIAGYTALSSGLDAEETHTLLNSFFAVVDDIVHDYGGSIDKHIGDAVMAIFGAPVAHTDDPARAARAALDIHTAVAALDPPMKVHVGIASGQVVASTTGSAAHTEYTVTGDSVNLAARLTDLAETDTTLMSAMVQRALGSDFTAVSLGEQPINGLPEPVAVWRLDGRSDTAAGPVPAAQRQALVGRAREQELFETALIKARDDREGSLFVLRGEAGIGKTHLTAKFTEMAETAGFDVHAALVLDFGTGKGQDAIRMVLRSLLSISPQADQATRTEAARQAIAKDLVDEGDSVFLNDLLDLPQPPALNGLYQAMENQRRNEGKWQVLARVVERRAMEKPLVIRLEDLHWADAAVLSQVDVLIPLLESHPVIMVATTRISGDPFDQTRLMGFPQVHIQELNLQPLSKDEIEEVVTSFGGLDAAVVEDCVDKCGGNPLLLEQLLRNVDELKAGQIPGTVQGIIQARIDTLPALDREALQAAAVLGQRFSKDALEAVLDKGDYDLSTLIHHVMLRETEDGYLFAHALIRDGVYGAMLRVQRQTLHLRAANWFKDDDAALYAQHLDQAGDPNAPEAYLVVARQAAAAFRYERALRLTERALELGSKSDIEFELTCLQGDLLRSLGQTDAALAVFEKAKDRAVSPTEICRAHTGLAECFRIKANYRDGLDLLEGLEVLEVAETTGLQADALEDLSRIYWLKGSFYFPLGDIQGCITAHQTALDFAEQCGSAEAMARAYSGLADAHYLQGHMVSASEAFDRCVAFAKEANVLNIVASNMSMVAMGRYFRGRAKEAEAAAREGIELATATGNFRAQFLCRTVLSDMLIEMNRLDDALDQFELAEKIAVDADMRGFIAGSNLRASWVHAVRGDYEQAEAHAQKSWTLVNDNNMHSFLGPWALGVLARATADPDRQAWALAEGHKLLDAGAVSHNFFRFYQMEIEMGLEQGNWDLVSEAANNLEIYIQGEPNKFSTHLINRARAILTLYRDHDPVAAKPLLITVQEEANETGFYLGLSRIEAALAEIG